MKKNKREKRVKEHLTGDRVLLMIRGNRARARHRADVVGEKDEEQGKKSMFTCSVCAWQETNSASGITTIRPHMIMIIRDDNVKS